MKLQTMPTKNALQTALIALYLCAPCLAACNLFMPVAQYSAPRQADAFKLIASASYMAQDDLKELRLEGAVLDGMQATDPLLDQTTAYVFLRAKDRTMDGFYSISQSGVSWVQRNQDAMLNPGNLFYQNGTAGFTTISGNSCIPITIMNGQATAGSKVDYSTINVTSDGITTSPVRMLSYYSPPTGSASSPWHFMAISTELLWLDSSSDINTAPTQPLDLTPAPNIVVFNSAFSILQGGGFWNSAPPSILRMGYSSLGSLTWMLFERRDDVQNISERVLAVVDGANKLGTYRYEPQGTAGKYLVASTGYDGVSTGFCLIGDSSGTPAHNFSMLGQARYVGEALCAPFYAGQTSAVFCVLSSSWEPLKKKTTLTLSLWAIPVEELETL